MSPESDDPNKLRVISTETAKVDPNIAEAVRQISALDAAASTGKTILSSNDSKGNVTIQVLEPHTNLP